MLPTGNTIDEIIISGIGSLKISVVDAANPLVFVLASDIGMSGKENPDEIDANPALLALLEKIRGEAAKKLGFIERAEESAWKSPTVPKMTIVAPPAEYVDTSGRQTGAEQADLLGRMMSMQRPHPTYALTGAMCTVAAAAIPGTIVYQARRPEADLKRFRIAHPGGILEAGVDHEHSPEGIRILNVYGFRTARLLMKGTAYY